MSIHICLITGARIFEGQFGGEGRFTESFGRWLAVHNYPVTLIGTTFSGVEAKRLCYETYNCESTDISYKSQIRSKKPKVMNPPFLVYTASRLVISLKALVKILKIHKVRRIGLIHAQDTGYSGLAAILSGKILRVPVIISSHGIRHLTIASQNKGVFNRIMIKFEYRLDLFCVRKSDGVIAVNPFIKKYYQHLVPEASKIQFIPTPVSVAKFDFDSQLRTEIRNEFGISPDSILLGFVGRLVGVKNLSSLLIAFSEALDKFPSMSLLLVGAGTQETDLRNLARSRGIGDKVIFSGIRADIRKILSAFDIFVLPSFTEGVSTSLLEAMASGRAVICSDIPANRELVKNDENGLIINPNKCDELRDAILRLAMSNELRARFGKAAIQTAKKYDEENIFPLIERYYKALSEISSRKHIQ